MEIQYDCWHILKKELGYRLYNMIFNTLFDLCFSRKIFTCFLFIHRLMYHYIMQAYEMRNAGAVIHSHGMESCLVTMLNPSSKEFRVWTLTFHPRMWIKLCAIIYVLILPLFPFQFTDYSYGNDQRNSRAWLLWRTCGPNHREHCSWKRAYTISRRSSMSSLFCSMPLFMDCI